MMTYPHASRYSRLTLLALAFAWSCDPFSEDSIPREVQTTFEQTQFFVQPGKSTVIDLRAIVSHALESVSLSVSSSTTRGSLTRLDTMILLYKPALDFLEGSDKFVCTVRKNGQVVQSQSITLKLVTSNEQIPCDLKGVHPTEDVVAVKQDSSVVIRFLLNDRFCRLEASSNTTSIYKQPRNGSAIIGSDSIQYTPASGFIGRDSMIYRITRSDGTTTAGSYGLVRINVRASCSFELDDSYSIDLTDDIIDPRVITPCGPGIEFPIIGTCPVENVRVQALTPPGDRFCIGTDGKVFFLPNIWLTGPMTADFNICLDEACKKVTLRAVSSCSYVLQDSYTIDLTDNITESLVTTDCGTGYAFPLYAGLENCPVSFGSLGFLSNTGNFCFGLDGLPMFIPHWPYGENPTAKLRVCVDGLCKDVTLIVKQKIEEVTCAADQLWKTITFLDESHAMAWCEYGIVESWDAGETWVKVTSFPIPVTEQPHISTYFFDDNTFVVTRGCITRSKVPLPELVDCGQSVVITTTNRGTTWSHFPLAMDPTAVYFNSPTTGLVAASSYGEIISKDRIYRTTNGGITWREVLDSPHGGPFFSIDFFGPTGFVAGWFMLRLADDLGEYWSGGGIGYGSTDEPLHRAAVMIDPGTVLLSFPEWGVSLLELSPGIGSKSVLFQPNIGQLVFSRSRNVGIAVTYDGTAVFRTIDKAQNWTRLSLGSEVIRKVQVPSDKVAYLWTAEGKLIKHQFP